MKELLTNDELLRKLNELEKEGFDDLQINQIKKGLMKGLDVSIYSDKDFTYLQMCEIRLGIEEGVDITVYANKNLDEWQMQEIRYGDKLDISEYAHPSIDVEEMQRIRWHLKNKLDHKKPLENQIKFGYKAFNLDLTCIGFQYKEDKVFEIGKKPKCCRQGFHFCLNLEDCFSYYNKYDCIIHKVEILGDIDTEFDDTKCCTNKIKILERLDF